jgi:hypothetical protein
MRPLKSKTKKNSILLNKKCDKSLTSVESKATQIAHHSQLLQQEIIILSKTPLSAETAKKSMSKLSESVQQGDSVNLAKAKLNDKTPNIFEFMQTMATAMQEMSAQLKSLHSSVSKYQQENLEIKKQLNDVNDELQNLKSENLFLKTEMNKIQQNEANYMVALHGVPENSDDKELLKKIGRLMEIDVAEHQIADMYRINTKNKGTPQPLVVKFTSKATRSLFIVNRKKKSILTCDLGVDSEKNPIFVNEYLTKHAMQLLNEAKMLKKDFNFKFVWPKNGVIFARKDENSDLFRIENFNSISEIVDLIKND